MNYFNQIRADIIAQLTQLVAEGKLPQALDFSAVCAEPPRDASHGDVATNAAMVLCKQAGAKPRDIAMLLSEKLETIDYIEKVDIAGPGFVNLRLKASFWEAQLKDILLSGTSYGSSDLGNGKKINIEYVSANPTGPMHIGHSRGAIFGDALASLMQKAGFDVTREYYVNDAGSQIDVLARSLHMRYREAHGENIGEIPAGLYPGEYVKDAAKKLVACDGDKWLGKEEDEFLLPLRVFAVGAMLEMIKEDLAAIGIKFDVFFSENEMIKRGDVKKAIDELSQQGLLYEGVLEPPKGKLPDDWEPRPQTLFKASEFGDDVDRALKKSDGTYTYFASDIAYHEDKYKRGYKHMIDVWGADHGGYVKRMKAAIKAFSNDEAELDVKLCQMVNLLDNGAPVKMSKRAGKFVTLRDMIDAVGKDVMRFIMLTRKNDAQLDFDLTKVLEQSKDNPVFYVQYAHARCHSVLRKGEEILNKKLSANELAEADFALLSDESEMAIIKFMSQWPRVIEGAAENSEPHRIAYYLGDLAAMFHGLWNKGRDDVQLRFLDESNLELTKARLALVIAIAGVVASGLEVFGVEPVKEM